jgi:hypothetical protein
MSSDFVTGLVFRDDVLGNVGAPLLLRLVNISLNLLVLCAVRSGVVVVGRRLYFSPASRAAELGLSKFTVTETHSRYNLGLLLYNTVRSNPQETELIILSPCRQLDTAHGRIYIILARSYGSPSA